MVQLEQEIEIREGLPHLFGWKWYPWQKEFFESTNRDNFVCAANQIGKQIRLFAELPTPTGWKKNGDLVVGDTVYGRNGKEATVTALSKIEDVDEYIITFDDGSSVSACLDHQWICKTSKERFRKTYTKNRDRDKHKGEKYPNPTYNQWVVRTTKEIISAGQYSPLPKSNYTKCSIPVCEPVEYPVKQLVVDPYLLGLLIGDGSITSSVTFCTGDEEIRDSIEQFSWRKKGNKYLGGVKGIRSSIKRLGLLGSRSDTKFIPDIYLLASKEQRFALLRGLMDTDGSIYGKNTLEYCTVSEKLKDNFVELINSLGGIVNSVSEKNPFYYNSDGKKISGKKAYSIRFKMQVNPFKLKRKSDKWRKNIRYRHERIIEKIEKSNGGKVPMRCIAVDNEDHSYLVGKEYIVTHNSTIQICKAIHWATETSLWPKLWHSKPTQFWYFYPSLKLASKEYKEKWVKEILPRNGYENDDKYGWKADIRQKDIYAINFNSGVTIYFNSYSQNEADLQAGTVYSIFCDEELPENLWGELQARLRSTRGYYHQVFTATLGQEMWRRTIEERGKLEYFTSAFKKQVSLFDCQKYDDESDSPWTDERIKEEIARCGTQNEVDRRIMGKFVLEGGLIYSAFDRSKNVKEDHKLPGNWLIYSAVDIGSGGKNGHPAAIVFVAVSPDFQKGRMFKCWRGDAIQTTAADILLKYREMRGDLVVHQQIYDFASKDFEVISSRLGETFLPAEKNHEIGEHIVNSLFQNNMLHIYDSDEESRKLVAELVGLRKETPKKVAHDDLCDALRYCVCAVPWDFSCVDTGKLEKQKENKPIRNEREEFIFKQKCGLGQEPPEELKELLSLWAPEAFEWEEYHNEYY